MSRIRQKRKPRAVAAALPDGRQPVLVVAGTSYVPRNISEGGMAVWVPTQGAQPFEPGKTLDAEIRLGGEKYAVRVEVRHHDTPRVAGLRFVDLPHALRAVLEKLLEPGSFADGMVPVAGPEEDPQNGFHRLTYGSPTGGELTVWYQPGGRMIVALQAIWGNHWVYRFQFKEPQAGRLRPGASRQKGAVPSPDAFAAPPHRAEPDSVERAGQFLSALPNPIPANLLWQFLESGEQAYLPETFAARGKAA